MTRCKKCRQNLDQQVGFRSHLHLCRIPRQQWGAEYASRTPIVLTPVDAETEAIVTDVLTCVCGYEAQSSHGLRVHEGRAHKAVTVVTEEKPA